MFYWPAYTITDAIGCLYSYHVTQRNALYRIHGIINIRADRNYTEITLSCDGLFILTVSCVWRLLGADLLMRHRIQLYVIATTIVSKLTNEEQPDIFSPHILHSWTLSCSGSVFRINFNVALNWQLPYRAIQNTTYVKNKIKSVNQHNC